MDTNAFVSSLSSSSFLGTTSHAVKSNLNPLTTRPARDGKQTNTVSMSGGNVLIVNTKGGGHGHIGLHLAEKLLGDGNKVHIHQIGNETSSQPIKQYPKLLSKHPETFNVSYGPVPTAFTDESYTAIYDNNAKSSEDILPAIQNAKLSHAQLFYVSSAGAYKYDANIAPHETHNPASGATIDVENLIINEGVCSANFRPLYIIGPHTSKREYIDHFFNRLTRNRPILLPGSGDELTSITDVRDIANLLASALDNKSLKNNIINCCNTRGITFKAMVQFCADACGIDTPQVVSYDVNKMEKMVDGFKVKKAFPFRPRHFFADPVDAQMLLGWKPEVSGTADGIAQSIKVCYEEYVALGLDKVDVDFSMDDKILANI